MVLDGPRSDSIPVRWDQVIAIREVWTRRTFADWEPSPPLLTAYELHLAGGQARFMEIILAHAGRPDPAGEER
jgi:hypothetical protein